MDQRRLCEQTTRPRDHRRHMRAVQMGVSRRLVAPPLDGDKLARVIFVEEQFVAQAALLPATRAGQ